MLTTAGATCRDVEGRTAWLWMVRAAGGMIALLLTVTFGVAAWAQSYAVSGEVRDPAGQMVVGARVELLDGTGAVLAGSWSDASGQFGMQVDATGRCVLVARAAGLKSAARQVSVGSGDAGKVELVLSLAAPETVAVHAAAGLDVYAPDPAEKVFVTSELMDANPGRAGTPVSVPGFPVETASGGIKAPQYFAPGVAGDHGEPIAQYIAVGGYLLPNNLSANAHGNGYADPNMLVGRALEYVEVDGGSFNVREGNHAVNLAATYGLRGSMEPFAAVTGDERDIDVTAGTGGTHGWVAGEAGYGNGLLRRLEHRAQLKANGERVMERGRHRMTLVGIAYYGKSYVPGLVPLGSVAGTLYTNADDTVDPRQREQTHTALVAVNDDWKVDRGEEVQFSGFVRSYNLGLYSDFGQGLIRQREFRTAAGANAEYARSLGSEWWLLAGVDTEREAPRNDDLDRYGFYAAGVMSDGVPTKVDGANVTITPVAPFAAVEGRLGAHAHVYGGWRRDEIDFANQDLVTPGNSFHEWIGVNSPKATVSVTPGAAKWTPVIAASAGESFFTEDPRIGTGSMRPTPVSRAHAYQMEATEALRRTQVGLTVGQTTSGEQLAKIDPDTGLQEDQGPGRVRFATVAVRHSFSHGWVLATLEKADARDLNTGEPTAEAPRTIVDVLGTAERLPLRLNAKAEFEYIGAKPLGTGCAPNPAAECVGVPVKELRMALTRSFREGRITAGLDGMWASGYTGQTLESFYPSLAQQATGVRAAPYAGATVGYRF